MIFHIPSGATGMIRSLKQTTVKVLVNKVPYYQYKDNQIYGAQMRKEIPLRPHPDETGDRGEMGDRVWNLLTGCWNYTPRGRPSCKTIQGTIARMKIRHKPSVAKKTETSSAFWEAMREGHDTGIDHARIEEILLRVSFETLCTTTMELRNNIPEYLTHHTNQ